MVLMGSSIRVGSGNKSFGKHGDLQGKRTQLQERGSLMAVDGALRLLEDVEVTSAHKAASFVLASDAPSTVWKRETDPEVTKRVTELLAEYQLLRNRYERLTEQLHVRLEESLLGQTANDPIAFTLQSRTKSESSLEGKLERKLGTNLNHYGTLGDVPDLAAVRVLVYEPLKVKELISLITDALTGDRDGDLFTLVQVPALHEWEHKETDIDKDKWYCASHLTVRYSDGDAGFHLTCEIQVTDIMSHVINEIGHDLVYKDEDAITSAESNRKSAGMDVARMKEAFRALFNNLQSAQESVARVSVLATEVNKG